MIILKLDEMLDKRNMTAYALHKVSGLHQSVISKIRHNKSKALQLDVLDKLCESLECLAGDLIVYQGKDATQGVKATQSANATQSVNTTQSKTVSVKNDSEKLFTTEDVGAKLGLSKKSVTDYINKGILRSTQHGKRTPHFISEFDFNEFEVYYRNLTGKPKSNR
jgi:putative transcriptional regulator